MSATQKRSATDVLEMRQGESRYLTNPPPVQADFLEAGASGPLVILVHSSVSGARQWRRLMEDLQDRFRIRAVNLFGYGNTPLWPTEATQSLDDQARLIETALPDDDDKLYLVGHSFGGAVAMKAAARLADRVTKLVLLETNPFYLLGQAGRVDAFAEAMVLRNDIKKFGALGNWAIAAERFANYWSGAGTWENMPLKRRIAFADALRPNFFEWDAVMNETTTAEQWALLLPLSTLLLCDPATVLPIREITKLLRKSCPEWGYQEVIGGGHMAPLSRPDLINPIVSSYLEG
jgi:pimeloyl-ACP methyl ester carboxylesterase